MNAAKITPLRPPTALSVLVVEDDVLTRCAIADELRSDGYRVLEAGSVADAVAILGTVPVHLVFVDLHVPGPRDGLRVARFAQDLHLPPRIILTSGKVRPEDLPEAAEFGPFVVKPYLITRVLDLIRSTLDPAGN